MRRVHELTNAGTSTWLFDGAEFPVVGGDETTHIDFILRWRHGGVYLVCECKRADPAIARWCFARAPYTWRNPRPNEVTFEQLHVTDDPQRRMIHRAKFGYLGGEDERVYHLGFELRTTEKGDGSGHGGQAINKAVTQVLRGTSGLIDYLSDFARSNWSRGRADTFIPAIFTTAQIWVTDADLGNADLTTGNLAPDAVQAQRENWIWFAHNRSPRLQPSVGSETPLGELSAYLRRDHARAIAIISPDGIDDFLQSDLGDWLT
ncbi:MAG: hypothetical protein QOG71_2344 [Pyrinomonadaceae bacterium]|nr:hypothetical protein [Pyrinomonadaceae bacterium]